jgi:carboxylate-amine ligase
VQIDFNASPGPSLGIEMELELIDLRTGELASAASEILAELGAGHPGGEHPKAKHELFESCIEIITGVCTSVAEAKADLAATLEEVREAAGRRGLTLMCSGSHPYSPWSAQRVTRNERYEALVEEMQWMAHRLQIFGIHVHVGIRSAEKAVRIANALSAFIPHFLALSASSPFWEGRDTGLASARSKVFEGLPTAGLPVLLETWADFETYMGTLVSAEAITTVREVWWDIRPHPDFGTVELRMCDGMPTLTEVAAVAAMAQSLVAHLDALDDEGAIPGRPNDWILRHNKWRAGRHGIDAPLIIDELGTLRPAAEEIRAAVAMLAPQAELLGCSKELAAVEEILDAGPSYARQRAVAPDGTDLFMVVDLLVRELREDRIGG